MSRSGAMAGLTSQALVTALLLGLKNIVVTLRAGCVAGVHHLVRGNLVDGGSPVKPILPECLWHQQLACDDQCHSRYCKQNHWRDQLSGNSNLTHDNIYVCMQDKIG
jgi:hypothetical protein